ncbi:putative porin [Myxococcota bacterium]|nr:putative porin [Myxococcota bacterium]
MKTHMILLFAVMVSASLPARAADPPLKFNGDLRLRQETLKAGDGELDHRQRLRLRLGALSEISEQLELGIQIATGNGDPVSLNQTLSPAFEKKPMVFDLAYFRYKPLDGLSVLGGKIKNPFYRPGDSQLVWDSDLTPEGLSVLFARQWSRVKVFATGVAFWTADRRDGEPDAHLLGGQAGAGMKFGDFLLVVSGALYNYTKLVGRAPLYDDDACGNTVDATNLYVNDYNLVDAGLELRGEVAGLPFSVFGNFAYNLGADEENTAFMAGVTVGELKKPKSWRAGYNYRVVKRDAVYGTFSDSDFGDGGTGTSGHMITADFAVNANLQFGLTVFLAELDDGEGTARRRLQLDMILKF